MNRAPADSPACQSQPLRAGMILLLVSLLLLLPATAQAQITNSFTGILREVYTGIPGATLADLTNSPAYPNRPASTNILRDFFEAPVDAEDHYGQRLRAYILPPITGNYVFWISGDDQSALFLGSTDDPSTRVQIAQVEGWTSARDWDAEPGQESAPIRLEAGRRYYIEALMKEGEGGDHLSVRWQLPNGMIEEPIPASRCLLFGTAIVPPRIRTNPSDLEVTEGEPALFLVELRSATPAVYQWERNRSPIPGASSSHFTNPAVSLADNGALYRVVITNSEGSVTSSEALLKVRPDLVAPVVRSVVSLGTDRIRVRYSEPVANASRVPNYQLIPSATILSAAYEDSRTVILTTTPLGLRSVYNLRVSGITDTASARNPIAVGASHTFAVLELSPVEVGLPADGGSILPSANGFLLTSAGSGFRSSGDEFLLGYQERVGDFDVKVRVDSFELGDPWAKAGILARENLGTNSRFAAALTSPGIHGSFFVSREQPGTPALHTGGFPSSFPDTWLRLRRTADRFTGYGSLDGLHWSILGSARIPMTNRVFLGLALASNSSNQPVTVDFKDFRTVTDSVSENAGFSIDAEMPGPSSRNTPLVISEIMFDPAPSAGGKNLEFIEVYNSGIVPDDLSGFRLDGSVQFVFPEGTRIASGGFLVVAARPGDLEAASGLRGVLGGFDNPLPNNSGEVRLVSKSGGLLLRAAYSSQLPFPASAAGAGHSLVLSRPSFGERDPRAWSASSRIGGSPGRKEPLMGDAFSRIRINEILAHTDEPDLDYIELLNTGTGMVDLSGAVLTDSPGNPKFKIPEGTRLAAGAFAIFKQDLLGFALNAAGETVYLFHSDGTRILDAVRFGPQLNGVAWGRTPDGSDYLALLDSKTPAASNARPLQSPVVLNEIHYHPVAGDERETFVELLNTTGSDLDLSSWRLGGGINFTFPSGTILGPSGLLVVAADASFLRESLTNLSATSVIGNFSGRLSGSGETLTLSMPESIISTNVSGNLSTNQVWVVMESVSYRDGGRWGRWSDGGGATLERKNPFAPAWLPDSWADSSESVRAPWTLVEQKGVIDNASTSFVADNLQILLMGQGECLVDQVEVTVGNGPNLVSNGSFEAGLVTWTARGTHALSSLSREGFQSSQSLRVIASARGDTGPNQVFAPLTAIIPNGTEVTIRARVKWLRGNPEILFRLHGNGMEAAGRMNVPVLAGTPGRENSVLAQNPGPSIMDVSHQPALPSAFEPVRITARVTDPDGVQSVRLLYRIDPGITVLSTNMVDSGDGGDLLAGDGIYSALLPGHAAGILLAFHIEASDPASPRGRSLFPDDAPSREAHVLFGDTRPSGGFGDYHIWFTQATENLWINRGPGSNDSFDATFVYGNGRVIYNARVLYSGSPFHWTGYNGPLGGNCNYLVQFSGDQQFLGARDIVLNSPSNLGNDNTGQREQTFYWMVEQLGQPVAHRRYHHLFVNGNRRGNSASAFLFEDAQQPNDDFVGTWFPTDPDGELFKIEDWFEYASNGFSFQNVDASLQEFLTSGSRKKLERYRWTWRKRGLDSGESAHDYSRLFDLVNAVNEPDPAAYDARVSSLVDVQQWMTAIAMRHVVGDWDAYGYRRGKNMYAYKPTLGKWKLLHWDIAFGLGQGDGPTTDVFSTIEPQVRRMFQHPPFRRLYLQAVQRAVDGPLHPQNIEPLLDSRYLALTGGGLNLSSPASVKSYVRSRRSFLTQVLNSNQAPFAVEAPSFSTNRNLIEINGTAPIRMGELTANGRILPVRWTTVSNWVASLVLNPGENAIALRGTDLNGRTDSFDPVELKIRFEATTTETHPRILITEIQYDDSVPGGEFIEVHNASPVLAADLSSWRLDGVDTRFPPGSILPPGGFLVVPGDAGRFKATFGGDIPLAGSLGRRLPAEGRLLTLVDTTTKAGVDRIVDVAAYRMGFPWPESGAGGASLQRVLPPVDGRIPAGWISSSTPESGSAEWSYVSVSGLIAAPGALRFSLSQSGSIILDDIELVEGPVPGSGPNLIANPGFESGLTQSWSYDVGYLGSSIARSNSMSGLASLRLVRSSAAASTDALFQLLPSSLIPGRIYTLSFWYRPESGGESLTVSIPGSRLAHLEKLPGTGGMLSTPGKPTQPFVSIQPPPAVLLNELNPRNQSGVFDPSGVRRPWLEIHNPSDRPASTSRLFLSVIPASSNGGFSAGFPSDIWNFPEVLLAPGEFRLVWFGGAATGSDLHANIPLPAQGGMLVLGRSTANRSEILDFLEFSELPPDQSVGRFPDSAFGTEGPLSGSTPGASNSSSPGISAVVINEWMAANVQSVADPADGDFEDWVELHNKSDLEVDLGGYSLSDDLANAGKWRFPAGTRIKSRGFLLIWADEETTQNSLSPGEVRLHSNFRLSQQGEAIGLFSPSGLLLDAVRFGLQSDDVSQGRSPDGAGSVGTFQFFRSPTPGTSNQQGGGAGDGFEIRSLRTVNGDLEIRFATQPGVTYLMEESNALAPAQWRSVSPALTATGPESVFRSPISQGSSMRFYRILRR